MRHLARALAGARAANDRRVGGDRTVVLLGPTELLDAARIAGLSSARDAIKDVASAVSRVQPAAGTVRSILDAGGTTARVGAAAAAGGHTTAAWGQVHLHARRAADLIDSLAQQTRRSDDPVGAQRFGGLFDAETAALQLRSLSRAALAPDHLDVEDALDLVSGATTALERASSSSVWHHAAPGRAEARVHFVDDGMARIVGDGLSTGSAAERTALAAHATLTDTQEWFRTRFGHAGFDGAGHDVDLRLSADPTAAFAEAERTPGGQGIIHLRGVDAVAGGRLADVHLATPAGDAGTMTHEYAHLVLLDAFDRGADAAARARPMDVVEDSVHEGLADVFEALRTRSWSIGHDLVLDGGAAAAATDGRLALRHVGGDPATSLRPLATTLQDGARLVRRGETDPHVIGGIVSTASRRLQDAVGWERLGDLTWATVQGGKLVRGDVNPKSWAAATMQTARELWSGTTAGDARVRRVQAALRESGFQA